VNRVVSIVLGGGRGTRLFPLTKFRSKPAVPIGSKYRLIDIPISNCLHSGVERIFVLTQFNSASLHRHISATYRFDSFSDGFVEILAAEQTMENTNWYQGNADAVRRQMHRIMSRNATECLILSGDHLYRMDYRAFVEEHRQRQADVTIAVKPVPRHAAPELGILQVDGDGRVVDFVEKPKSEAALDDLRLPERGAQGEEMYLASMGVYVFECPVLTSMLIANDEDDFGRDIIPDAIEKVAVFAHRFDGYWQDIGSIRAFYDANMMLTNREPAFEFYKPGAPIYTHQRYLAGSRIENCRIDRSIVAEGCRISEAEIERSVIGVRSTIARGARLYNTILMGADYYESPQDHERRLSRRLPAVGIGAGTVIHRAIVDKNARIGEKVIIANEGNVERADGDGYYIRDGIVVVPKDAVVADGTRV
jgi:glucose-1-phosphate adenylyltransferase